MYHSTSKLHLLRRLAALVLAFVLGAGLALPALADGSGSCGNGIIAGHGREAECPADAEMG